MVHGHAATQFGLQLSFPVGARHGELAQAVRHAEARDREPCHRHRGVAGGGDDAAPGGAVLE